jgi:hypothetical protein
VRALAEHLGNYGKLTFRKPMNGYGWRISAALPGAFLDGFRAEDSKPEGAAIALAEKLKLIPEAK